MPKPHGRLGVPKLGKLSLACSGAKIQQFTAALVLEDSKLLLSGPRASHAWHRQTQLRCINKSTQDRTAQAVSYHAHAGRRWRQPAVIVLGQRR